MIDTINERKMKNVVILLCSLFSLMTLSARNDGYDFREPIGNGLYKVRSGQSYYGIVDENNNVVVSVEYDDIKFNEGKALLSRRNRLYGYVDSLGKVKRFSGEYRVHPLFRYFYDGYIPVANDKNKWTFINEDENLLMTRYHEKKGFFGRKTVIYPFDAVVPFVEGYAMIFIRDIGWRYIDRDGNLRFILDSKDDDDNPTVFASSVYKGECLMQNDDGLRLYQENDQHQAVVKRVINAKAELLSTNLTGKMRFSVRDVEVAVVYLDSLMRATKYLHGKDSVVFIEPPKPKIIEVVKPVEIVYNLEKDFDIALTTKSVRANSKGRAYAEIEVRNASETKYENVEVLLECAGVKKNWSGKISSFSDVVISFNIPARFPQAEITRKIKVTVKHKDASVVKSLPIKIKRYRPVNRR